MPFVIEDLAKFPTQPGVYIMKDENGRVIYVGKAKHLKNRIKNYFSWGSGDSRAMVPFLVAEIHTIDTMVVPSEKEALLLENTLIKKHQPKYNALLKDDKTFIGLLMTPPPWPMLRLVRYKGKPREKGQYFGPYVSAYAARQVFDVLLRVFPLRQCSDEEFKRRTRPCLLYSMKKCVAPCVGKCTREEYDTFVEGAVRFLKGQNKEIVKALEVDRAQAAEALEFERAAALHKTIQQIREITEENTQLVAKAKGQNSDVIAVYREGYEVAIALLFWRDGKLMGSEHFLFHEIAEENSDLINSFILQHYTPDRDLPKEILVSSPLDDATSLEEALQEKTTHKIHIQFPKKGDKHKLLEIAAANAKAFFLQKRDQKEMTDRTLAELEEKLHLNRFPTRIECFDISNLAGHETVASMVAYTDGEKDKKRTRLFKIKEAKASDDYGAMREVLTRRLSRAREEMDLPDLIIVDGGKGQLNIAIEVLKELNIASVDAVGLAKEQSRHDKGLSQERVFLRDFPEPITFTTSSPLLFFLQRVRDDAHRLAIGFHRKRRTKTVIKSALEDIPGIGPVKKKRLLSHFGSIARLGEATDEELAQISGLTPKDIKALREFLTRRL